MDYSVAIKDNDGKTHIVYEQIPEDLISEGKTNLHWVSMLLEPREKGLSL